MIEETQIGDVNGLTNQQMAQIRHAAEEEAQCELSRISDQVDASTRFLMFGITHGGKFKEKILLHQLVRQYNNNLGVVIVPKWSAVEHVLKNVGSNLLDQAIQCYVKTLFETILQVYPTLICGVICDANLGVPAKHGLTSVVEMYLANYPRINSLRLFTATPTCAERATIWSHAAPDGACYKLSEEQCVGDHATIANCIHDQYQLLVCISAPDQESSEVEDETLEKYTDSTGLALHKLTSNPDFKLSEFIPSERTLETSLSAPCFASVPAKRGLLDGISALPKSDLALVSVDDGAAAASYSSDIQDVCEFPGLDLTFDYGAG